MKLSFLLVFQHSAIFRLFRHDFFAILELIFRDKLTSLFIGRQAYNTAKFGHKTLLYENDFVFDPVE